MQIVTKLLLTFSCSWLLLAPLSFARQKSNNTINEAAFKKFTDYTLQFTTHALLIAKDNQLIYEYYAKGHHKGTKYNTWSISKSVLSTLIGIAQKEKIIHVQDPLAKYIECPKEWQQMTMGHLLTMTSGIRWSEQYNDPPKSDVVAILYNLGKKSIPDYILSLPLETTPGTTYHYSSGNSALAAHVLGAALGGGNRLREFAHEKLFSPLGIENYTIEGDAHGNFYGGSHFYLTARDLLKFGRLHQNKGLWKNKPLYSKSWHRYFTTLAPPLIKKNQPPEKYYGASWTLNKSYGNYPPPHPFAPRDTLISRGFWGQILIIIPSQKLVAVRLAQDRSRPISFDKYFQLLMESLK